MEFPLKTIPGMVAAYFAGMSLLAFWVTIAGPRNWAVTIPDSAHTYGIRIRGTDLFFRPSIGWFIEHGGWVCLALVVSAVVAEAVGRAMARGTQTPQE